MSYTLPLDVFIGVDGIKYFPRLIQKESFEVEFRIKDRYSKPVDVSSATSFTFYIKPNKYSDAVVTRADGDFIKTGAAAGIIKLKLTPADLDRYGETYMGLLVSVLDADTTDKAYFEMRITASSE